MATPDDCPLLANETAMKRLEQKEFRLGLFSAGDLIALCGIVFMSGALWIQVIRNGADLKEVRAVDSSLQSRISVVESTVPANYVNRIEYREDTKEIKALLSRIEQKLDAKADKR